MRKSNEGLTFQNIEISNFKNITKTVVDIGGQSLFVLGKNGSGKSSFIQALMSPLDTKVRPSSPIKAGEERSSISVTLGGTMGGEKKEYVLDLYFSPAEQKGRLVITNSEGETIKSPATFVKSLIGNVSFDVTKWLNESKDKKLATLKQLTGCAKDIDEINVAIKELKDAKKLKNARVEDLQAVLKNHGYTPDEVDKYSNPVDIVVLQTEMGEVSRNQQTYDGVKAKVTSFSDAITTSENNIEKAKKEIERLEALVREQHNLINNEDLSITKSKENIKKGEEWLAAKVRPSIEEVSEKMNNAIKHNEHYNKILVHAGQQKEMLAAKGELDKIAGGITVLEEKRGKIISGSQLPIKGLSFDDDNIYLDSLPLEDGQINTAKLWDIGVDIAIALNPGLKVIFLHDGSLLDKNSMKALVDKIENHGYQCIAEVVSESSDLDVEFVEKIIR